MVFGVAPPTECVAAILLILGALAGLDKHVHGPVQLLDLDVLKAFQCNGPLVQALVHLAGTPTDERSKPPSSCTLYYSTLRLNHARVNWMPPGRIPGLTVARRGFPGGDRECPADPWASGDLRRAQDGAEPAGDPPGPFRGAGVFAVPDGKPISERNLVRRHFKPLLVGAGLPETIRLYDLRHTCATLLLAGGALVAAWWDGSKTRHTCATLLLAGGEHPKIVSERLGHANIILTLDTYSHVLPDMQQTSVGILEAALFPQGGQSESGTL